MKARTNTKGQTNSKSSGSSALQFSLLPDFARFILDHHLEDYIAEQIKLMVIHKFPMFWKSGGPDIPEEELVKKSVPSQREFLEAAATNSLAQHLGQSLRRWREDKLLNIGRDELMAEDITLSSFIRKTALLRFAPLFVKDLSGCLDLVREIEEYALQAETLSFNTFIDLNNRRIRKVNRQLGKRTGQLLEAQELASIGSFEWDLSGRSRTSFTPQVYQILGLSDLTSLRVILSQVHRADRDKLFRLLRGIKKGKKEFECEFRYEVGERERILWCRGLVESREGVPARLKGTLMDVTARHELLRELQKNDELYRQAERIAHLGNWTYDVRSGEITWSDELYRIFGMSPQSKEITLPYFLNLIHPEDRPHITRQLRTILVDLRMDYRLRVVLPSGEVKHLLGKGEILKDELGKAYKLIGTCQDITREVFMNEALHAREESLARLNLSLEEKNTELQRKNDELTSFNYVASHDLQEPLRKIKTFSDLLLTRELPHLSEAGRDWVERISGASARMQKLIEDLLAFSRTQFYEDQKEVVDLNAVLEGVRTLYQAEIRDGSLKLSCCDLPSILGIPYQLQQLFENLISNSLKYHKDGENTHVSLTCDQVELIGAKNGSKFLRIVVSDEGIGFEQRYADRIFQIFQRLHGQFSYSGTGIGLAICKKIAENHHGFIRAEGVPTQGSRFSIYFPEEIVVPG